MNDDGICSQDDKALYLSRQTGVSTDCLHCIVACNKDEQWQQCIEDECFEYGLVEKGRGSSGSRSSKSSKSSWSSGSRSRSSGWSSGSRSSGSSSSGSRSSSPPPANQAMVDAANKQIIDMGKALAKQMEEGMAKNNHQCDRSMLWKSTLGHTCDDPEVQVDWRDQSGKPAGNYCSKFCAQDLVMKALQEPNMADWSIEPNWRPNQSYGCRINDEDWSNSCDREEIEQKCKDNPSCIGYYSTGICFVAADKKPTDCTEPADTGRYAHFFRKRDPAEAELWRRAIRNNGAMPEQPTPLAVGAPSQAEIEAERNRHWNSPSPPAVVMAQPQLGVETLTRPSPALGPTSSCYGAKLLLDPPEPQNENTCCTCEDVKDAHSRVNLDDMVWSSMWQCMSPNNNACQSPSSGQNPVAVPSDAPSVVTAQRPLGAPSQAQMEAERNARSPTADTQPASGTLPMPSPSPTSALSDVLPPAECEKLQRDGLCIKASPLTKHCAKTCFTEQLQVAYTNHFYNPQPLSYGTDEYNERAKMCEVVIRQDGCMHESMKGFCSGIQGINQAPECTIWPPASTS